MGQDGDNDHGLGTWDLGTWGLGVLGVKAQDEPGINDEGWTGRVMGQWAQLTGKKGIKTVATTRSRGQRKQKKHQKKRS